MILSINRDSYSSKGTCNLHESENSVWLVASQQTQHDYCNDYTSQHCNYLLKLLLGTLIAICSLTGFEKMKWWTSARGFHVGSVQRELLGSARRTWAPCHAWYVLDRVFLAVTRNFREDEWEVAMFKEEACGVMVCVWRLFGKNTLLLTVHCSFTWVEGRRDSASYDLFLSLTGLDL